MGDLDVRWNDYSHREIVRMVNTGPGPSLTAAMEDHLKNVALALDNLSDQVSQVIQRTGADWQGRAADMATNAMWVLRTIDDGMYFASNLAGIRAFGQSDSAGWVRTNMPPVVEVHPPAPTGGLIDIVKATVDFQNQQAAAKQAEQRAREIMEQYTNSTRERAAAMTPLTPVPQVVLEISDSEPASPRSSSRSPQHPGGADAAPRAGVPGDGPDGAVERVEPPPTNPNAASKSVAPEPTRPAAAPDQAPAPTVHDSPNRTVPPAGGGSSTATPPPAGGFAGGGSGRRPGARSPNEGAGRGGVPAGGRGVIGGPPAGGPPAGGAVASGRGSTTMARVAAAGGLGAMSPFGAGAGARREEDEEHRVRFELPSAEHFEADEGARDPHREGWHVAPPVIGDEDEDGDNQ